jgi:mono/diheme cytochrome c family protein
MTRDMNQGDATMKKYMLITIPVLAVAFVTVLTVFAQQRTEKAEKTGQAAQRGRYLVTMIGCNDCHTPLKMGANGPEPDMTRFLSGHPEQMGPLPAAKPQGPWLWAGAATNTAFTGPWGVSYAANLTPDQNTGLGIWTEDMFVRAIRTGRHMGTSREILPPMPWPAFRNASDSDLKAIYAYLRTIKPVTNHVPDVQPPPTQVAQAR